MSVFSIGFMLASVIAAQPLDAGNWVTTGDYPTAALRQRRGGYVGFRLTVSSQGAPTRCEVLYKSGHDDLDALSCELLMRRARFAAARDANGSNAMAVFSSTITWWAEGIRQMNVKPQSSDLDLIVSRLPKGLPDPVTATVAFEVDRAGAMLNCTPIFPQPASAVGSRGAHMEQRVINTLGMMACMQAKSNVKPQPATDGHGNTIATIQTAKITFLTDPAAQ